MIEVRRYIKQMGSNAIRACVPEDASKCDIDKADKVNLGKRKITPKEK